MNYIIVHALNPIALIVTSLGSALQSVRGQSTGMPTCKPPPPGATFPAKSPVASVDFVAVDADGPAPASAILFTVAAGAPTQASKAANCCLAPSVNRSDKSRGR